MKEQEPFETIYVDSKHVSCDGGKGPLGHPHVYLEIADKGRIVCPYCSKMFIYRPANRLSKDDV